MCIPEYSAPLGRFLEPLQGNYCNAGKSLPLSPQCAGQQFSLKAFCLSRATVFPGGLGPSLAFIRVSLRWCGAGEGGRERRLCPLLNFLNDKDSDRNSYT